MVECHGCSVRKQSGGAIVQGNSKQISLDRGIGVEECGTSSEGATESRVRMIAVE